MNKTEIMKILPHRDNMLLIDEVHIAGGVAFGKKLILGDEWFLKGHFPGNPVVPGVILCEILAQSACVFLAGGDTKGKTPYFTGLDKVKFKKSVLPGDIFETRCEITRSKGSFYFGKGTGFVGGKLCVEAEFSFAVI
jgi:3-hydroxyacyl-[acyl-carrier-protein] dehydratase